MVLFLHFVYGYRFGIGGNPEKLIVLHESVSFWFLVLLAIIGKQAVKQHMNAKTCIAYILFYLRMLICCGAATYFMMVMKWWAHHGELWDGYLLQTDLQLAGIVDLLRSAADLLNFKPDIYFYIYAACFVVTYAYAGLALGKHELEKSITLVIAIMLIGGGGYMLMPAYGPLVYERVMLEEVQSEMIKITDGYRRWEYDIPYDDTLVAVLGAMPSLHVAHSLALTIYAIRLKAILALFYVPALALICIYASATRFHYIADMVGGIIVAGLALLVTEVLFRLRVRHGAELNKTERVDINAGFNA